MYQKPRDNLPEKLTTYQSIQLLDKEVTNTRNSKVKPSKEFRLKCQGTSSNKSTIGIILYYVHHEALMDETKEAKEVSSEEERLRKELRLARKRIAQLEEENESLKKLLKLDE